MTRKKGNGMGGNGNGGRSLNPYLARTERRLIGPKEAKALLAKSDRLSSDRIVDFMIRQQQGDIAPGALHWLSDGLDIMSAFMVQAKNFYDGDLDALDATMRRAAEELARTEWEQGNEYDTAGVCPRHVILAAATTGNLQAIEWAFLMAVRTSPMYTAPRNAYIRMDNLRFAEEKRIRENQVAPE